MSPTICPVLGPMSGTRFVRVMLHNNGARTLRAIVAIGFNAVVVHCDHVDACFDQIADGEFILNDAFTFFIVAIF